MKLGFFRFLSRSSDAADRQVYKDHCRRLPEVIDMGRGRPSKCPRCGSLRSVSKGYTYRVQGKARDKKCKECGRRYLVEIKAP